MIADEALEAVFGRKVLSRYMERAPKAGTTVWRLDLGISGWEGPSKAMVHFDGTARHQSVGPTDEPWLHQLLLAVGKLTGLAALINTSFNTKGWGVSGSRFLSTSWEWVFHACYGTGRTKNAGGQASCAGRPIVNSVKDSLLMLDTLPDLDYVLIEDWPVADAKSVEYRQITMARLLIGPVRVTMEAPVPLMKWHLPEQGWEMGWARTGQGLVVQGVLSYHKLQAFYCGLLCQADAQCPSGASCRKVGTQAVGLCIHPLSFSDWVDLTGCRRGRGFDHWKQGNTEQLLASEKHSCRIFVGSSPCSIDPYVAGALDK
eukprot:Skav204878  [mRNA]  locus=scaffold2602:46921:52510:+ [translate_table: standard]